MEQRGGGTVAKTQGSYRLQIRLPDDWRAAVESAAEDAGQSASDWAREQILRGLPKKQRKQLGEVSRGRPKGEQQT